MSTDINLYKLNDKDSLVDALKNEFYKEYSFDENEDNDIKLTFFYFNNPFYSRIRWDWIITEFGAEIVNTESKPKAVLVIEDENEKYAASFGYSYHLVGKFSDKNWPLEFAERMNYNTIKSVGILSPNSLINRKIYNYFNYDYLDADSGEALNNIVARLKLDENSSEYISDYIIIGNSIKFKIKEDNMNCIFNLMGFVKEIMNRDSKRKLPKLKKVMDKERVNKLNDRLIESIRDDIIEEKENPSINISEFTVEGSNYIFYNSYFDDFGYHLDDNEYVGDYLSVESIYEFIKSNNLTNNNLLDMKITMMRQGKIEDNPSLKKLIMYSDDETIFNEGLWYEYNKLFFNHIHQYLDDIYVNYDDKYDFLTRDKFNQEREKLKKKLDIKIGDTKFEFFFNNYVADNENNCICFDTKNDYINQNKFEPTDVLDNENHTMYAVKVGNNTGVLSYVIDQSLYALKLLDDGEVTLFDKTDVENVGLWIVFTRGDDKFNIEDNRFDWKSLKMLIFKSKIADWKKQVLLSGRKPVINVNYRFKPSE